MCRLLSSVPTEPRAAHGVCLLHDSVYDAYVNCSPPRPVGEGEARMNLPTDVEYPVIAVGDLHGRVEWLDKLVAKLR